MTHEYGRTFMQNFNIDHEKHRDLFLGYIDQRLDEGDTDRQQLIPEDSEEVSDDIDLIYDIVDAMAVRDNAREHGKKKYAGAVEERVEQFFEDVQRIDRQLFKQMSAGLREEYDNSYENYLEDLQTNTGKMADGDQEQIEEGLKQLGLDQELAGNLEQVNNTERQIEEAEDYQQLRQGISRFIDAQRDAMQAVSDGYDQDFMNEITETAEQSGILGDEVGKDEIENGFEALEEDSMTEEDIETAIFGMLKQKLYMKVAPLPAGDRQYLS